MGSIQSDSMFPLYRNQSIGCTSNKSTGFFRTWNVIFECMALFETLVNVAKFLTCDTRHYSVKSPEAANGGSCEFCEIFKNTFFYRTLPVAS